jgi:hypothetical protein
MTVPSGYYLYLHRRKSDNVVYYVGKGSGKRAWVFSGRNRKWTNVHKKHGTAVEIVFDGLTEQEALDCEVNAILEYRYLGFDLANFTSGGESPKHSSETIEKIRASNLGKNLGKQRSTRSDSWCRNLSNSQKGRKKLPSQIEKNRISHLGLKASEETKLKMSEIQKLLDLKSDKTSYLFFSADDVFVGTRKEFCDFLGVDTRRIRTLFCKNPSKVVLGWSLFRNNELLIFKEIYNANCI